MLRSPYFSASFANTPFGDDIGSGSDGDGDGDGDDGDSESVFAHLRRPAAPRASTYQPSIALPPPLRHCLDVGQEQEQEQEHDAKRQRLVPAKAPVHPADEIAASLAQAAAQVARNAAQAAAQVARNAAQAAPLAPTAAPLAASASTMTTTTTTTSTTTTTTPPSEAAFASKTSAFPRQGDAAAPAHVAAAPRHAYVAVDVRGALGRWVRCALDADGTPLLDGARVRRAHVALTAARPVPVPAGAARAGQYLVVRCKLAGATEESFWEARVLRVAENGRATVRWLARAPEEEVAAERLFTLAGAGYARFAKFTTAMRDRDRLF